MSFIMCDFVKMESMLDNEDKLRCGSIYIRSNGIISLACGLCDIDEFQTLDAYKDHFNCHFPTKKPTQPQTTSIKAEQHINQFEDTHSVASFESQISDDEKVDGPNIDNNVAELQSAIGDKAMEMYNEAHEIIEMVDVDNIGDSRNDASGSPALTCDYCQINLSTKNDLIEHMWLVHSFGFWCSDCGQHFRTRIALGVHRRHHKGLSGHTCGVCNTQVLSKAILIKHMWNAHMVGLPCRHCNKHLASENSRKRHEMMHTGESRPARSKLRPSCKCSKPDCPDHKFICDICNAGTSTKCSFAMHKWKAHGIGWACKYCGKHCVSKQNRNVHESLHTMEQVKAMPKCNCINRECTLQHARRGLKPFECEHCDTVCVTMREMRKHWWTIHKLGYQCRFCEKHFHESSARKNHERIHTHELPYSCKYCSRSFAQSAGLKLHTRVHENERPFLCTLCGASFVVSNRLKLHTQEYHTTDYRHTCTLCNETFTSMSKMKYHRKSKHNTNSFVFTCDICQRQLKDRKCLVQHMCIHNGTKAYKCRYCELSFAQAAGRRGHERHMHNDVIA